MTESEGVIKYRLAYLAGELPPDADLDGLFRWFRRCRAEGLIGQDPGRYDGIAYGNISQRLNTGFVISGTQTGGKTALGVRDLAWVTGFDPAGNRIEARGPARPSSEAMTHAQVYQTLAGVNAVIHVHSPPIWHGAALLGLPMTATSAAYGTPAMAAEVARLLTATASGDNGLFVMGGHEDGVVAYGRDMDSAGDLLFSTLARAGAARRGRSDSGSGT